MRKFKKKKKIFDVYSQNLKWIKEKTNAKFKVEFDKGVLCPLCLEVFLESDLKPSGENYLTLEHNPPKSLGGKDNILTCKECNNKSGHKTDIELLTYLLEQDFKSFSPNSEHRTKLKNSQGSKVTADLSFDNEGKMTLNLQSKYSNPKDFDNFLASEERGFFPIEGEFGKYATRKFQFNMKIPDKGNMRLASIALLKIGYLLGFEKYGHIFLFNQNLDIVREQILNPEKEIITDPFWINYEFPEMYVGANTINKPKELICFLNTFVLKTKSREAQISIAFPGYNKEDAEIYKNIKKILCSNKGGTSDMEITTFDPFLDLKDENRVFSSAMIWDKKKSAHDNV
ncbi:MAG: HNH endonuclease [Allomuricauda sp.]